MTEIKLREYQVDAIAEILNAWGMGTLRPAVVLPTGAGKTVVFAKLVQMLTRNHHQRPLILVNRDELVRQTADKISRVDAGIQVGVVQAARNELDADVVVASVQTLSRANRLAQVPDGRFTHVIADEAHFAASDSWRRVLDHLALPTVGFTATMFREDKKGLGEVWDEVVFERDTRWAIDAGFLVEPDAIAVTVPDLDLDHVRRTHGDYSDADLGKAMTRAGAGPLIAQAYLDHCKDETGELRRGICFAPTIATAEAFLADFRAAGIPTELVIGSTPIAERQDKYAATHAGVNKVLMSVGVLTTGFDLPAIEVAVIARPTRSKLLYVQAVGRALRLSPETGKTSARILDVSGATRHGLISAADLSLDQPSRVALDAVTGLPLPALAPELPADISFVEVDAMTGELLFADPMEKFRKKIQRRPAQRLLWDVTPGGLLYLPKQQSYSWWTVLRPSDAFPGQWDVWRVPEYRGVSELLHAGMEFPEAMWNAMLSSPLGYQSPSGCATDGQLTFLRNCKVEHDPEGLTGAEASRLISRFLASRRLDA